MRAMHEKEDLIKCLTDWGVVTNSYYDGAHIGNDYYKLDRDDAEDLIRLLDENGWLKERPDGE